jgi:hypothetical protein
MNNLNEKLVNQRDALLLTLQAIVDIRMGLHDSAAVLAQGRRPLGNEDAMILWAQQAIAKSGGAA